MRSAVLAFVLSLAVACAQVATPASTRAQTQAIEAPAPRVPGDSLASIDREARAAEAMYAIALTGVLGGGLIAGLGCLVVFGAGPSYLSRDPHGAMAGVVFGLVLAALGAVAAFPLALGLDLESSGRRHAHDRRGPADGIARVMLAPGPGELGLGAAIVF